MNAVALASNLGKEAFHNGLKSVPAHDPALYALLVANQHKPLLAILDAWIKAWHAENIAQPV